MRKAYSTLASLVLCSLIFGQNPQMLKDIFPGNNAGTIQNIVKTPGYTFFNEDDDDADTDRGLFRTDGTNAGTIKINLTYPGYISTKAEMLTPLGNKVVFAGDNFAGYGEIWSSDGSQAGTVALERFQPINNKVPVVEIKTMGSYSYYSVINKSLVDNLNHAYLRRTDGTAAGTSLVYDFSAFTGVPQVLFLTPVNNILYFIVYDQFGTGTDQLWRSDGTSAGTYLVYDFTTANFVESYIMPAGNHFYIMIGSVVGGVRQNTIWNSDGTAAGTAPLKFIGTGNTNLYPSFAAIGSTLYFAGADGNGKELWKTDGTAAGTIMVADINSGGGNSAPSFLTPFNGNLYFAAENPTYGGELWKYDGTVATLIKDINPGNAASVPQGFVVSGNSLLFSALNNTSGRELWITDGTSANTVMIADINPGANSSSPNTFTPGNTVYFAATNGTNGVEVFKYDNNGDAIGGPTKFYVNDNSTTGDLLTLGIGSNSNNGSKLYPFATISYAVTQTTEGDTIYVDAGTYTEQVTIDKGLTIIGAGQNLTSITNPGSPLVAPPGTFPEYALIQTAQNIGDVNISNLQTTNVPANDGHSILLQTGGSVKNCRIIDGGLGVFVRVESAVKTVVVENNFIQASVFAVACQGSGLTASVLNNTLNVTNPFFSVGIWVGLDFGPIVKLTATGNAINNYVYRGIVGNSRNTLLSENSILGTGQYAIENTANLAVATCNWYGTTDQTIIAAKMNGNINFSPWLVNGTDNDPAIGFQPVPGSCAGRQLFFVNDNSLTGDIYTTAVGNNANNGSSSAPLATITAALTKIQAGDFIIVDAGSYTEIVNVTKNVTILGAGKGVTILNGPAGPVTQLPNTGETGIIQTVAGVTDVIIENLTVDGTVCDEQHGIFIQGGGRVSNCELRYVNDGFYFQFISTQPRTAIGNNNYVHHINYVGFLFAGKGLSGTAINNVIDLNGALYGIGGIAGYGGDGVVASFTASNNSIINFNGFGMMVGSTQIAQIHNNSITRLTGNFFQNVHTVNVDATCNWYGTTDAAVIIPNVTGDVTYSPWLTSGTDNDVAFGFQPLANVCNGRQNKFYVNDNSLTGNTFTTAVGNDANTGIPSAPLLTLNAALTKAQAGDSIFVDAGIYVTPNILIDKSITILGSNYLINPNDAVNALLPNASRNSEAIISGSTFTIGANNINVEGLTLDPGNKSAVVLSNTSFGTFKFTRNKGIINTNSNFISIFGTSIASPAIPAATGYDFTFNRFEKLNTTSGITFYLNSINYINIDKNAFVVTGPTPRTQVTAAIGLSGLVYDFRFTDNLVDRSNHYLFTFEIARATITGNKLYNGNNGLFIQSTYAGSSDILIENNYIESSLAAANLVICRLFGGNNAGSTSIARIKNNTINFNGTGLTFVPHAITTQMAGITLSPTLEVSGNKINHSGNYNLFTSSNVFGISLNGKLENTVVRNNEITFSGTNLISPNPATPTALFTAGILLSTDGATNATPAGSIISIQNNKISGYKQSIALYDQITIAPNTYTGYGNLPAGVVVNVNNNSFTGDSISINNGTVGQSVNATCNWYGTASAQGVVAKVTPSTVVYSPWLTSGIDSDIPAVGFQPAGLCNGTVPVITLNASTNVTCFGANNGTINISVTGGSAPYNYSWIKNGEPEFASSSEDITSLAPGTYHLTLTDANGSAAQLEVIISEPSLLTVNAAGTNVSCNGGNNGTTNVAAGGGTLPYTYLWSNGSTNSSISNLSAGIYSVTVTDGNGCTKSASYQVTQPTLLTAVASGTSTSCANTATVVASGGTLPYSYAWSNGAATQSITSIPAGTYTVIVTDNKGCTASSSVTVTATEAFNPSASVTNVSCFGGSTGSITITNVNGVSPFQFSLNGVDFSTPPSTLPYTISGLGAGTYTIAVKDANGCTGFVAKTITEPPLLVVTQGIVQSTCSGQSTGSITVTTTGGSGSLSYSWTGPGVYTSIQKNISGLATGNYVLTVTDASGCSKNLNVNVPVYPVINVTETITNILCYGTATGSIDLTVTGGTGSGFTYLWNNGATTQDRFNLVAGTNYKVTITDISSGCTIQKTYAINQPLTSLNISFTKTNATSCNSLGMITAVGSGGTLGYTYSLNNGSYQPSGSFVGLYAGSYTVTVKDANGCTKATAAISVTDNGQDDFESNNSKNQAKAINLSTTISARIATATDVADWFKFTTTTAGSYTLMLTHPSATFTYNIYAAGNNTPALTPTSTTATSKVYTLAANTTYYIGVTGGLSYICYDLSVSPTQFLTRSSGTIPQNENVIKKTEQQTFEVKVFGNPSQTNFGLQIFTNSDDVITIRVVDVSGRIVEVLQNVQSNKINRVGEKYRTGAYFAEIIQGKNRKVIKLIKM